MSSPWPAAASPSESKSAARECPGQGGRPVHHGIHLPAGQDPSLLTQMDLPPGPCGPPPATHFKLPGYGNLASDQFKLDWRGLRSRAVTLERPSRTHQRNRETIRKGRRRNRPRAATRKAGPRASAGRPAASSQQRGKGNPGAASRPPARQPPRLHTVLRHAAPALGAPR